MRVSLKENFQKAFDRIAILKKFLPLGSLLLLGFAFAMPASGQNVISVKGHIANESGQPVVNASILIKGAVNGGSGGVTSNENGNFEISAAADATLIVSSVGYVSKEFPVNGSSSINITLSISGSSLDQVIVIGYGTQKKRDVTGSVVSVSAATLQEVPTANLISELKGRAAGVDIVSNSSTPGASGQIRIRGNRTLSAEVVNNVGATVANNDALNGPLLVLDGVPFNGSINDLNPDNISNVDILKDASATAIYGSRGSNGVIMISTKRGRPGKAVMSYNGYYGLTNNTGEYKVYGGAGYAALKQEAALGNTINPGTTAYGLTTAEQAGLSNGTSTDWQKLIYKQGYTTNHELSLSGGSEGTQFSLGGGYFKETGIIPGQDFTRYSLRTTIDHQINRRLKIGINTLNSLSYTNGANLNPVQGLVRLSPLTAPYNADGTVNMLPQTGAIDGAVVNPLSIINNQAAIVNSDRRIRTFNSLYGEWEIIKGLKYRVNVGLDFRQDQYGNYNGPNTFYNSSLSNSGSNESVGNAEAWTYTIDNLLTYDRTFNKKHHITFTGLYGIQKDHSQSSGFSGSGLPADYIQYYNLSLANTVQANTATSTTGTPSSYSERGLISYMARLNYAFEDRFLLTATVRTDGSSVLSPGNQYFTYPAFAVGWNIGNENFMKGMQAISNLKLRAGWGVASSQSINPYATLGLLGTNFYNFGAGTSGQNIGYLVQTLANKNLKWQSTAETNIGLDFGLFNNRLSGSVDYYSDKTKNILLQESLPGSNGAGSTIVNAGQTKGYGIEVSLSSINIQSAGGFNWSTDVNFSISREQIVALQNPTLKADYGNGWIVGQPLSVIYDLKKTGIWQTADSATAASFGQKPGQIRIQDISGPDGKPDGKIDQYDRQIIGNFQPQWIGGLTNRISYKNFDFSFVIFARMGMKVAVPYVTTDGGAQGFDFFNNGRNNQVVTDYWTHTNPTNKFPRPDASADKFLYASTLGYTDGSFIKMRSINLGYTIPSNRLNKAGINSLRVYVSVQNPFIIYSPFVKDGYGPDPEGNGYGGAVSSSVGGTTPIGTRVISVNLYAPPTRMFQFGLNLKF